MLGPHARSLCRILDAGRLVSDLLNMRPEFFGEVIDRALQGRGRHIKLGPANPLIGFDIAELFKTLQRCAHRAIGAACNLDKVFALPRRSGRLVLKLGLSRLAVFYDLQTSSEPMASFRMR